MAFSQAEPLPWLGGGGGPPGVDVSFDVSAVVLEVATCREADGEVGVSPHQAEPNAHATMSASPSVRGERGI